MSDPTPVDKPLRIAAVGDLHVHATHEGEFRQLFAEIAQGADVLALCGDLTHLGTPEEARCLATDLGAVKIPIVAVLGNHDHHAGQANEVKAVLRSANVRILEDDSFEVDGVGFAGAKGFGGGFGSYMLDRFGEGATKSFVTEALNESLLLEHALRELDTQRAVVLLHYAPIAETVKGEPPEIFPFLGCSRLGETIDRFNVSAVFHGHAHHGSLEGRTTHGVRVYNCSHALLRQKAERDFVLVEV